MRGARAETGQTLTPVEARSCRGKRRFQSLRWARATARRVGQEFGREMVFYRCRFCVGWHLATSRRTPRARRGSEE